MKMVYAILLLALAVSARAEVSAQNFYASARIDEWAEYKTVATLKGKTTTVKNRQTVIRKTDDEVTLKVTEENDGQQSPTQSMTIDLREKWDPADMGDMPRGSVKETGSGAETIKV